jgi:pyruvate carboxylase subunit B
VAGPDANLQTLARGVNIVCLDSASSDVIALHARLFKKHGITTIRNFDALNDVNNLVYSGQCIHDAGLKHQVVVTMMALPPGCTGAHDPDFYEKTLREILKAGIPFDSVCFKDASGTSIPAIVFETIKRARKLLPEGTQLQYHTHETAGCGVLSYKAALDAGADVIDLSLAPVSGGTCQPDVIVMWHALRGTDYDLGVDIDKVREAEGLRPPAGGAGGRAADPVVAHAGRRAHRQHPDASRQQSHEPLRRNDRGHVRGGPPRRVRHLRHPGLAVLFPAGV